MPSADRVVPSIWTWKLQLLVFLWHQQYHLLEIGMQKRCAVVVKTHLIGNTNIRRRPPSRHSFQILGLSWQSGIGFYLSDLIKWCALHKVPQLEAVRIVKCYCFFVGIYMASRLFPTRWIIWHDFPRPLNAARSPTLIHILSSVVEELRSAIILCTQYVLKVPETIDERSAVRIESMSEIEIYASVAVLLRSQFEPGLLQHQESQNEKPLGQSLEMLQVFNHASSRPPISNKAGAIKST